VHFSAMMIGMFRKEEVKTYLLAQSWPLHLRIFFHLRIYSLCIESPITVRIIPHEAQDGANF
jgi:hypothetical protein